MIDSEFVKAFDDLHRTSFARTLQPARLGIKSGSGYTISVPGQPGWVYISKGINGEQGQTTAYDAVGVAAVGWQEIKVRLENRKLVIREAKHYTVSSGGGSGTLDGLSDVSSAAAVDGDLLAYAAATGQWIPFTPSGTTGGAPSPHALDSTHHSGQLADTQALQFLKTDGSRSLTGNLVVESTVTIDGVDISAHAANPDAHHNRATSGNTALVVSGPAGVGQVLTLTLAPQSGLDIISGLLVKSYHGLKRDTNGLSIQPKSTSGLVLDSAGLAVGAGDGIDVLATSIAVDVTDIIDTAMGLTESANNIQIKLDASSGLQFAAAGGLELGTPQAGAHNSSNTVVGAAHAHAITASADVGTQPQESLLKSTASGGLTLATLTLRGNLTFAGGNRAITASNDLDISPSSDLHLSPGSDIFLQPGNILYLQDARDFRSETHNDLVTGIDGFRFWDQATNKKQLVITAIKTDELIARVFTADEVRINRGEEYWSRSYGIVWQNFTLPALGAVVNGIFENAPALGQANLFTVGDWLLIRGIDFTSTMPIFTVWMSVDALVMDGATGVTRQTWRLRYQAGGAAGLVIAKGTTVLDVGQIDEGWIHLNALNARGGPYLQMGNFTSLDPTPVHTNRVRMGRLSGTVDIGSIPFFGFAAGNSLGDTPESGFSGFTVGYSEDTAPASVAKNGLRLFNSNLELYNASNLEVSISQAAGIRLLQDSLTLENDARYISWHSTLPSGPVMARLASFVGGSDQFFEMALLGGVSHNSRLYLSAQGGGLDNVIQLDAKPGARNTFMRTGELVVTANRSVFSPLQLLEGNAASTLHVYESNNATDSTAGLTVQQEGVGDAVIHLRVAPSTTWSIGIDNSFAGDPLKIAAGPDVGIGTLLTLSNSGALTVASTLSAPFVTISDELTVPTIYGTTVANGNLVLQGTSSATQTSSFVLLQPGGVGRVHIGNPSPAGNSGRVGIRGPLLSNYLLSTAAAHTVVLYSDFGLATGDTKTASLMFARSLGDRAYTGLVGVQTGALETQYGLAFVTHPSFGAFDSDNAETMRLTHAGQLGLGVTTPASRLHIYENTAEIATPAGLTVEQAGAGDAVQHFRLTAPNRYFSVGIDHSDGDKFKISLGAELGVSDIFVFDPTTGATAIPGFDYEASPPPVAITGGDGIDVVGSTIAVDATVVRTARTLTAGAGLTGGGDLTANRTFNVGAGTGILVNADTIALDFTQVVATSVTLTAGNGLTGGGDLGANLTLAVGQGSGISVVADAVAVDATVVRTTLVLTAGNGLTGGGDLSLARTFAVGAGDGMSVSADAVAVDTTVARSTWAVVAGSGLSGGGNLAAAGITLNVVAASQGGITVNPDSIQIQIGEDSVTTDASGLRVRRRGDSRLTSGLALSAGVGLWLAEEVAGAGLLWSDASNRFLAVGAGAGIAVGADDVAVNQGFAFTWTALHTFNGGMTVNGTPTLNGDLLFNGAGRRISSSADFLLRPTGSLTLNPTTGIVLNHGVGSFVELFTGKELRSTTFSDAPTAIDGFDLVAISGNTYQLTIGSMKMDNLYTRVFTADETRVNRGEEMWGKSFGILQATLPSLAAIDVLFNAYFENSPALGTGKLFTVGDFLQCRVVAIGVGASISTIWLQVVAFLDNDDRRQRWQLRRRSGGFDGQRIEAGNVFVDFGQVGDGIVHLVAYTGFEGQTSINGPYMQYGKAAAIINVDDSLQFEYYVRIGNLNGVPGVGAVNTWGLAAGTNLGNSNLAQFSGFVLDGASGLKLYNTDINLYDGSNRILTLNQIDGLAFERDESSYSGPILINRWIAWYDDLDNLSTGLLATVGVSRALGSGVNILDIHAGAGQEPLHEGIIALSASSTSATMHVGVEQEKVTIYHSAGNNYYLARFDASGKVSFGTPSLTAPASTGHFYEFSNEVGVAAGVTIEQGSAGDAVLQLLADGTRWVFGIDNSDSNKLKIALGADLNTAAQWTLTTAGQVGIGTIAPLYKLDVRSTTTASQLHIAHFSADTGFYFTARSALDVLLGNAAYDGAAFIAKTTAASLIQFANGNIHFYGNTGLSAGSSYSPTELARFTPSGRLGIGNPNPSVELDVTGTINSSVAMTTAVVKAVSSAGLQLQDDAGLVGLTVMDSARNIVIGSASFVEPFTGFVTQNNQALVLRQPTATSGNTPFPTILISNNQTGASNLNIASLQFMNEASALADKRVAQFTIRTGDSKEDGEILLRVWEGVTVNEGITIKQNGAVGIGTQTPQALETFSRFTLFSNQTTSLLAAIINQGAGQAGLIYRRTGATPARWQTYIPSGADTFNIYSSTLADSVMTFTAAGRVGIGTSNPTQYEPFSRLTVSASDAASHVLTILNLGAGTTALNIRRQGGTASNWGVCAPLGASRLDIQSWDTGKTAISFLNTGLVGINETAPAAWLEIATENTTPVLRSNVYGVGGYNHQARRALGTKSSPSALAAGSVVYSLAGFAYTSAGFAVSPTAEMQIVNSDPSLSTLARGGGEFKFFTRKNGNAAVELAMTIGQHAHVSIGGSIPDTATDSGVLNVVPRANDITASIWVTGFYPNCQPALRGYASGGSFGAPTQTLTGHYLLHLSGRGHTGSDYLGTDGASLAFITTQNQTTTQRGAKISFSVTDNSLGSAGPSPVFEILQNGRLVSPTTYALGAVAATNKLLFVDNNGAIGFYNIYNTGGTGGIPVYAESSGRLYSTGSSRRYKNDIRLLTADKYGEDFVMALQPVSFTYKTDETKRPQIGLIAEDVQELGALELVVQGEQGQAESLYYDRFIVPLILAVQRLTLRARALEQKVKQLEKGESNHDH